MNKCFRCFKEHNGDNLNSCPECSEEINLKIRKRIRDNQEQTMINSRFEILDL